jgi:hypothetical protein
MCLSLANYASAQPTLRLTPSVAFAHIYDDNILVSASGAEPDFVTRLTPALDLAVERPFFTVHGTYRLAVERFVEHPTLTTMNGRQNGSIGILVRRSRGWTLSTEAAVTSTRTPGELNTLTGFAVGRAEALRVSVRPSVARELTRHTRLTLGYSDTLDRLDRAPMFRVQGSELGLVYLRSESRTLQFGYGVERVDAVRPGTVWSQRASTGLRVNRRSAGINITLGARVTAARVSPEVSASLQRAFRSGHVAMSYVRTQTTVVGPAAFADTDSFSVTAGHAGRRVQWRVMPGVSRMSVLVQSAHVFRGVADASIRLSKSLELMAEFDNAIQRGRLDDGGALTLSRRVLTIGLRLAPIAR